MFMHNQDYRTRKPLIRCDSIGPLYPVTKSKFEVFVSLSSSLWHLRIGHPGDHVLKMLTSQNFISCNKDKSNVICQPCQLGKHVRLPFNLSNSVLSAPFDIIHLGFMDFSHCES